LTDATVRAGWADDGATRVLRGTVVHVPRDPFAEEGALEVFEDGALVLRGGRVAGLGDAQELLRGVVGAEVVDHHGALLIPGLVDAHVHYPQVPVIGGLGLRLLAWLEHHTLPEEARYADLDYARLRARAFLRLLAANGTTTAMVFGAHFAPAMDAFFEEAAASGLRITAGLTVSDRALRPELHTTPERALAEGLELAARWHGQGRLRYAVTPRFAVSAGEAMLEACGELLRSRPGLWFTTHLNETEEEVAVVRAAFPWARDYLDTYERYGLVGERSVFAHDVVAGDGELQRLAAGDAAVAHCPTSNMALGSGLFPLARHLHHGVRVALGSDVGGGTGLSLLKEARAAAEVQMLRPDGAPLDAAHLLWLATGAGARALGLAGTVGDFRVGAEGDVVVLRPPTGSTLEDVWRAREDPRQRLAAALTLAREESVAEVWIHGLRVHRAPGGDPRSAPDP